MRKHLAVLAAIICGGDVPQNIVETPATGTTVVGPSSGDPVTDASVIQGLQPLANRVAALENGIVYHRAHAASATPGGGTLPVGTNYSLGSLTLPGGVALENRFVWVRARVNVSASGGSGTSVRLRLTADGADIVGADTTLLRADDTIGAANGVLLARFQITAGLETVFNFRADVTVGTAIVSHGVIQLEVTD